MLLVLFRAGASAYAFDARQVVAVVPSVGLRPVPHAPGYVAGLLRYRGGVVPVVDFGALVGAPPGPQCLSTRVIMTEYRARDQAMRLVGVVAAGVNHVKQVPPDLAVSPAMRLDEAPYLGAILQLGGELVQIVEAGQLLSGRLQTALYGEPAEHA